MKGKLSVPSLALFILLSAPVGLAAQSVLVEAKTTAGDEIATIRTDSMRLLVPLHLLVGGLLFPDGTLQTTAAVGVTSVTSAEIVDGTIVNADISGSAGIADTKLGTISTAGKVANSATTATSANTAGAIVARGAAGGFSAGYVAADSLHLVSGGLLFPDGTRQTTAASTTTSVTSAEIVDGTIVNADISGSAGIADTKLGPITSTGKVANSATTATSSNTAGAIVARDGAGGFSAGYVAVGDSLRVEGEGSFLATGTFLGVTAYPPPVSGAGARMMWYPEKGAFRAGYVDGTQWDVGNVGLLSMALGDNSIASGSYSTALGTGTVASALASVALGYNATASGLYATALGLGTTAQADASTVIGRYNVVEGTTDTWVSGEPLFVAGNGTSGAPSNALTLYKDGNLTIAGTLTQSSDARLKEDMEPLGSTLDKVMQLTPIRYRFRPGMGRPGGEQIGLTAQQVRPLFPELVKQGADGYLSLSYANLSAVLVKAVKEQQSEIKALKAKNQALESELASMRASQAGILRRLRKLEAGQ